MNIKDVLFVVLLFLLFALCIGALFAVTGVDITGNSVDGWLVDPNFR